MMPPTQSGRYILFFYIWPPGAGKQAIAGKKGPTQNLGSLGLIIPQSPRILCICSLLYLHTGTACCHRAPATATWGTGPTTTVSASTAEELSSTLAVNRRDWE